MMDITAKASSVITAQASSAITAKASIDGSLLNNSFLMTFEELMHTCGEILIYGEQKGFQSVCIDSRSINNGALFVALQGQAQDGHLFIESAIKAGAAGIMAARSKLDKFDIVMLVKKYKKTLLVVEDTLKGLQDAARIYLEKFPGLLKIAITGSAGKTTTKEITASIIKQEKNIVMNSGNLNSETGLPLSVFNVRSGHEVGIFEAGMNRRGEIAELADVLKPNIALITNIGSAHIGILGSKWAIAEEKKSIFSQFTGSEKALIPMDDNFKEFLSKDVNGKVIYYSQHNFSELECVRDKGLEGAQIKWAGKLINFPLPGDANIKNAFAAIAIAGEIPVSAQSIKEGLESVKPLFGRSQIIKGRITLIQDCYNSSPESLESVLEFFNDLEWQGRKVCVIGSMLELGNTSKEAHKNMGLSLGAMNLNTSHDDKIFLFGKECKAAAEVLAEQKNNYFWTDKMDELKKALTSYTKPGDLVLLKGSRGCALEQLTPLLTEGVACAS